MKKATSKAGAKAPATTAKKKAPANSAPPQPEPILLGIRVTPTERHILKIMAAEGKTSIQEIVSLLIKRFIAESRTPPTKTAPPAKLGKR